MSEKRWKWITGDEDECPPTKNIGLRGVVVADSNISRVDGEKGELIYRGYRIEDLAQQGTFEEIVHLLLFGELPSADEYQALKRSLADSRDLPGAVVDALRASPTNAATMDVLQGMIPLLGAQDPDLTDESKEANRRKSLRLIARLGLVVAAWDRIRKGRGIVESRPELDHAANLLYTLHGETPDPETARDLDVCLILHADHSFNASTFTARQIASTRAHIYACVAGAVGSLSGELHGGANARVYQMLREIGSADKVSDYVARTLDEGGRIMGMGHAVYKVIDPRAKILGPMAERLGEATGRGELYELSEQVRQVTAKEFKKRKDIEIHPNVDFYSASVYTMMGFDVDLFTPLFAVSRVAGWTAHVIEEKFAEAQQKPALYRPRAEYAGNYCGPEGCEWIPLDKR